MRILILSLIFCFRAFSQVDQLEEKCLAGDGLACAKAAYHFKKSDSLMAYQYYKKGCELKEESACFNMQSYDPKDVYFKKVERSLAPYTKKIKVCYVPQIKGQKFSTIQYKENFYKADFAFRINPDGKATNVDVKTDLDKKFVDCAKKVITNISYPKPEGIDPTYQFYMLISAYE